MPALLDMCASRSCEGKVLCGREKRRATRAWERRKAGRREERVEKASFAVHLIIQPLRLCASRDHARFPHRRHRPSYYSLYTFITLYLLKYRARASEKA